MVSATAIEEQLKRIGFNHHGWGRTEVQELQNIILPDEEIYECVNGFYEGGFALLLATDVRVLLIDKKPLNYLTIEDLRFDMINEIDYNHRLIGAYISISAGNKNLKFTSVNQPRLRKLIGHVQRCMAEFKKTESSHRKGQVEHLEQINQQLQSYLMTQYQQQQKLNEELQEVRKSQGDAASLGRPPELPRPDPELADYLYAQSLLAEHRARTRGRDVQPPPPAPPTKRAEPAAADQMADLYAEGVQEIFGKHDRQPAAAVPVQPPPSQVQTIVAGAPDEADNGRHNQEINPLRIAYAVLPQVLRSRKFGRPSLRVDSQEAVSLPAEA